MVLENSFNKLIKARHGTLLYNKNDIYIGKSIEKYGEFSYLEAKIFEQICKAGDVVIEVGANIGAHTLYLSKLVGNGYVFAFEPQRLVFQNLCANLALNSISNVFAYQEAVSHENGSILIPECDFTKNNNFGGINIENTKNGTTVNRQKLDNFLNKIDRLKLLKIDVEGMEILVIKGAKELIDKFRPIIYIENDRQEHSKELIELLWSLDYKMYWHLPKLYNKSNFFCQEENIFGNIVSVNMFCIHKDLDIKVIDMVEVLDSSFHPMKR
ncbi:FkbM family methyltransferase [Aliarcobacter cryaerophilus]|uniref:FkbM family methyltransferase n=1 Tax=Aliarcobacter cryaerophilus TaxID=28198 RepID=UPI0021B6DBAD|nr:FkbM family methyltransferase [Aliarcobacter cryaerophilus]MCT7481514.1 FkbM family methyltransferase [Aliarcobacter cryaerophilus]